MMRLRARAGCAGGGGGRADRLKTGTSFGQAKGILMKKNAHGFTAMLPFAWIPPASQHKETYKLTEVGPLLVPKIRKKNRRADRHAGQGP